MFSAAQLGRNLPDVLAIHADVLRRPRLEDKSFEPCRDLVHQDLAALEDEPQRKCSLLIREKFYPHPLGRCVYGRAESLKAITAESVHAHIREHFGPRGAILAAAGRIDWQGFCDLAERHFGDWDQQPAGAVKPTAAGRSVTHVQKDSAQVHIALAHRAATADDPRYYAARVADAILSGGMSSRLITEVREKRGLAYWLGTQYHSLKSCAGMFTYAGTRPEVAQQTLQVTVGQLRSIGDGVRAEELERARVQLKSATIMHGESTAARAAALASDWYHLRRLRSLAELSEAIDNVTGDDVLGYARGFLGRVFTALVIGPEPLDMAVLDE